MDEFYRAAKAGRLPFYSFLEPRYSDYEDEDRFISLQANDQHPNHDIRYGEHLIADVYEALRDSPAWPRTAFIIVYDEHGGTFDHIKPPAATPPRKGERYADPANNRLQFGWDRLGPRVPAVVVSPLIESGTIDSTVYDHTSVFRTLRERDQSLKSLTDRDASANGLGHLFRRDTPRADKPAVKRPAIRFRTRNSTEVASEDCVESQRGADQTPRIT
jgi:phospholipase C